jgi:hypothetical protein
MSAPPTIASARGRRAASRTSSNRRGQRIPLKTKRSRRCAEGTPALVSKLRAAKVAAIRSGPGDLVFVTRNVTGHDHRNIGGRVLARAVKRAGLQEVELTGRS